MLNTENQPVTKKPVPAPTYRRPHQLQAAPVADPTTGTMYDVATLLQEMNRDVYKDEPLSEKLDLFLDSIISWADDDAAVSRIKEIHEILYRLRNAFAGVRIINQQHDC